MKHTTITLISAIALSLTLVSCKGTDSADNSGESSSAVTSIQTTGTTTITTDNGEAAKKTEKTDTTTTAASETKEATSEQDTPSAEETIPPNTEAPAISSVVEESDISTGYEDTEDSEESESFINIDDNEWA
ncbi:MAG TPA: hypothetical protein PLS20_09770 [Ruminococcus flavefaciens]|nr:hypothetical protein [Ruminococcus flavefaciens]